MKTTYCKTKAENQELRIIALVNNICINEDILAFSRFCAMQNIERMKPYCSEEAYCLIIKWLETGEEDIRQDVFEAAQLASESAAWLGATSARHSARAVALLAKYAQFEKEVRSIALSVADLSEAAAMESAAMSINPEFQTHIYRESRLAAKSVVRAEQEAELTRILEGT